MLRVLAACLLCLFFVTCEEKEDDKVFSAQACLDHASQATVDNCVAMLGGVTTAQSYIIRCSADFLRQGIDTSAIVSAIENIDQINDGQNATVTLLNAFDFTVAGSSTVQAQADAAVANCQATGSGVLSTLALLAKTATILVGINAGITTIDPNIVSDADKEAIGSAVQQMFPETCGEGGSFVGSDVCLDLADAIANGATPADIGAAFINAIKDTH